MNKQPIKTDSQIKKAIKDTTKTTAYPIAGYSGLEINVRMNAKGQPVADFRHRYTHPITGKRPYMTLGSYPAFTLEQARQAYNDNLALLGRNIDPIEHRQAEKQKEIADRKNTLQFFIDEWQDNLNHRNLSPKTYQNYQEWLAPIAKQFSQTRVTDIKPSDVIRFIKDIQKTHPAKGLKISMVLKSVLQIAKANGIIEYNPASDLQGTLKTHKKTHHPAITTPAEFGKLLNDIDSLADSPLFQKEILQLLALTFARVGDVCSMKWSDINFLTKQWQFRPQKSGNRDDMTDLVTPLAPQAIAILESMKAKTGSYEYVFYNARRKGEHFADLQQVRKVLNSPAMNDGQGYKGIHSPHGFRAAAKTMLKRLLKDNPLWLDMTELQLGHRVTDKYGRAYDRWDILSERTHMMALWANYLDDLRAGKVDNVIYLTPSQTTKASNE